LVIPVVYKLQCRKGVNGSHKHNKSLIKNRRWKAIDNYMFRPPVSHRQVMYTT